MLLRVNFKMAEAKTIDEHVARQTSNPQLEDDWDRNTTERRLVRKLDFRVIPVLGLLFLISFMDRGNIGNAHIQGMDKSLHLVHNRYNIAVQVFNISYLVFGLPGTLLFKKIGPKMISVYMFCWGTPIWFPDDSSGSRLTRSSYLRYWSRSDQKFCRASCLQTVDGRFRGTIRTQLRISYRVLLHQG